MHTLHRQPQVEEGLHNVILQNRAGNRLTALCHEESIELELVYKPNAFRRKEFRARNFSSRDNYTTLFADARMPEIREGFIRRFHYDPFITRLETEAPSQARNHVSLLNIGDENVFAISATNPLTLTFRPHNAFNYEDGLLWEEFSDRGEAIVSFVAFPDPVENRYRVLDDGRHVLQIMQGDVVLVGGEETMGQVRRVLKKLGGMTCEQLIDHTEEVIRPAVSRALVDIDDPDIQHVVDLNRRVVYSGLDEGGACFGALCRIYHLIWLRDGSMTAVQFAMAGNPEFLRIWAPFALDNPSGYAEHDGRTFPEYLQMVGRRWTKAEDDGIYYAVLTLFAHYRSIADDGILRFVKPLTTAVDYHIASRWDERRCMFGSDTLGETTLASSPFYGYDAVNGTLGRPREHSRDRRREISYTHSLYHNVNMFNVLRMMQVLLAARPGDNDDTARRYGQLADRLERTITEDFLDAERGVFNSHFAIYDDGTCAWVPFERGDYWEHAWAVSAVPFFPRYDLALASARFVKDVWPTVRSYGYCPWNTLSALLMEFGMASDDFKAMHADQLRDALATTDKYPMTGGLTEYYGRPDGWRCLPFSAATFINAVTGQIIKGLPQGVAVRASDLVEQAQNYVYRASVIDAESTGEGDTVESATVNGKPLLATLQIPEALLRSGRNRVKITRGAAPTGPRLFHSTARLFDVRPGDQHIEYEMGSAAPADVVFEGTQGAELKARDAEGTALNIERLPVDGMELVRVRCDGDFILQVAIPESEA